jgi:tetratricopeptide (TPR) repeat protein
MWPVLLAVAAVAAVTRGAYVAEIRAAPFYDLLMGDGWVYDQWARRIAAGDWLGDAVFYQAPLYPYVLACIHRVVGDGMTAVRVVQMLMSTASCTLLAAASGALFGRRGAWVSGLGLALYPPAIFLDGLIQKSALATLLMTAVLALLCKPWRRDTLRWAALGSVLGLLALTRENALVFFLVAVPWALAGDPPGRATTTGRARASRPLRTAALVAGLAAVIAPVAVRGLVVAGELHVTTSQLGSNFYIGNNPDADGSYKPLSAGRGDARRERDDATALAERALGRELGPREVSRYWLGRALAYIRDRPLDWGALMLRKAGLAVNAREMVDTEAQEVFADWSRVLRWLGAFHFGVLFPLALYGLVLERRTWRRWWVLPAMAGAYAASVVLFYVFARYRFPLVPLLLLFAASGVVGTVDRIRAGGGVRGAAPAAAVAALGALLANLPLYSPLHSRAVHYYNVGTKLHESDDRRGEARAWFERALEVAPDYPEARFGLATALAAEGEVERAVEQYRAVVAREPDFAEAHYGLGLALARTGRYEKALTEYRAVLGLRPDHVEAMVASGNALSDLGRHRDAVERFRAALAAAPGHVGALVGLGAAWARLGRLDEARQRFEQALAIDPGHAVALNNLGSVLAMQGRIADAERAFRRAVAADPDYADARRNLEQARRILAAGDN